MNRKIKMDREKDKDGQIERYLNRKIDKQNDI